MIETISLLGALLIQIDLLQADLRKLQEPVPIEQHVTLKAEEYGINAVLALKVLNCESSLRHEGVYGDSGNAYGIAQFWPKTFQMFKSEAGMPWLNYRSKEDQIELFSWAMANGKESHWTCWRKVVNAP